MLEKVLPMHRCVPIAAQSTPAGREINCTNSRAGNFDYLLAGVCRRATPDVSALAPVRE
jgi:hypothetical protein